MWQLEKKLSQMCAAQGMSFFLLISSADNNEIIDIDIHFCSLNSVLVKICTALLLLCN
jgi:hypothetical protein